MRQPRQSHSRVAGDRRQIASRQSWRQLRPNARSGPCLVPSLDRIVVGPSSCLGLRAFLGRHGREAKRRMGLLELRWRCSLSALLVVGLAMEARGRPRQSGAPSVAAEVRREQFERPDSELDVKWARRLGGFGAETLGSIGSLAAQLALALELSWSRPPIGRVGFARSWGLLGLC